jgi:hypothetical protein
LAQEESGIDRLGDFGIRLRRSTLLIHDASADRFPIAIGSTEAGG